MWWRATGMPLSRMTFLNRSLSIATRRAGDAGADVRDVRQLEQALDGPVLAERPVQDRQHDVDGRERSERAAFGGNGQRLRRTSPGARHQDVAGRAAVQRPATVAADGHAHHVVPLRIQRLQHRAGRRERDVVLARAPRASRGLTLRRPPSTRPARNCVAGSPAIICLQRPHREAEEHFERILRWADPRNRMERDRRDSGEHGSAATQSSERAGRVVLLLSA